MTPWADPHSAADGILDDETYDWLGVFEVMRALRAAAGRRARGGDRATPTSWRPRPASRSAPPAAPASPACSPTPRRRDRGERVAVIFSGVARCACPRLDPTRCAGSLPSMTRAPAGPVTPQMLEAAFDPRADVFNRLLATG